MKATAGARRQKLLQFRHRLDEILLVNRRWLFAGKRRSPQNDSGKSDTVVSAEKAFLLPARDDMPIEVIDVWSTAGQVHGCRVVVYGTTCDVELHAYRERILSYRCPSIIAAMNQAEQWRTVFVRPIQKTRSVAKWPLAVFFGATRRAASDKSNVGYPLESFHGNA